MPAASFLKFPTPAAASFLKFPAPAACNIKFLGLVACSIKIPALAACSINGPAATSISRAAGATTKAVSIWVSFQRCRTVPGSTHLLPWNTQGTITPMAMVWIIYRTPDLSSL
jgi:hypothetical protein